jgi:DNA repair exonuclease SbcCD nuclease subunit
MAYKCRNTLLQRLENGEEVRVYEGGKTIKNATINDAIFRENCTLDHAAINNSIFNDVKLKHSIIQHCVLHYCVLEFCTASNSVLKHCQVIKSPLALRRFAPEIRMLIFDYVIEGHGKTPKLVKALRGDQVMYREALEVLYKKSPIPLSFAKKMSPGDIQFIIKLVIE